MTIAIGFAWSRNIREEDYAVVAARLDGTWLMLDNRHMAMIDDHHLRDYHPAFLIDHDGVKRSPDAPSTSDRADISAPSVRFGASRASRSTASEQRKRFNFLNRELGLLTAAVRQRCKRQSLATDGADPCSSPHQPSAEPLPRPRQSAK